MSDFNTDLPPLDGDDPSGDETVYRGSQIDDETAENVSRRTRAISREQLEAMQDRTRPITMRSNQPAPVSTPSQPARQKQPTARGQHVQPIPKQSQTMPATVPPRPSTRQRQQQSSLYLPWWSLALMLVSVLVVSFGLVFLVYLLGNPTGNSDTPITPTIRIIPYQGDLSAQQVLEPTAIAPATEIIASGQSTGNLVLSGPTLEAVVFTPTPIAISVGRRIVVDGVDAQELNVRDRAGVTQSSIVFRAAEQEIFNVVGGPAQADGFTWWQLQDPVNPQRQGWAASNYLRVVPDSP